TAYQQAVVVLHHLPTLIQFRTLRPVLGRVGELKIRRKHGRPDRHGALSSAAGFNFEGSGLDPMGAGRSLVEVSAVFHKEQRIDSSGLDSVDHNATFWNRMTINYAKVLQQFCLE